MMISPNISSLPASTSSSSADDSVKSVCSSGGAINPVIKFLCSYGGMILPRYSDGKLRYVGGETRVLAVDRSVTFSELLTKMGELRGGTSAEMTLRCQLPSEDLDALISIRSDDDLLNVIEEYDLANRNRSSTSSSLKIRSFLSFPSSSPKSPRHIFPNPPAFAAPPPIPLRMVPPPQPASASFYMPSLYQRRHLQHYH
ncbi:Octicosapeptide/Phox/Bem1p domain-containing protein kinase [Zostera marina]|uniref:Octicosapeptide/Phox/Bem1p domain-containing protein kinase n=1 Tax=Zostera marina TaxID=29655 RepID=A0A0K9NKK9_ZOSMR|nr:Octicosapeptide/Phox/Bem1p domain-containing protein kinase [Zostera marina]